MITLRITEEALLRQQSNKNIGYILTISSIRRFICMTNKSKASVKKTSGSKRMELIDKSLMVSDNIAFI